MGDPGGRLGWPSWCQRKQVRQNTIELRAAAAEKNRRVGKGEKSKGAVRI